MTDGLTILALGADNASATFRGVVLFCSRAPFRREDVAPAERALREQAGKALFLCVIDPRDGNTVPPEETRRVAAEMLQRSVRHVAAFGIALLTTGFGAAMLRALVTGVLMTSRGTSPAKVAGRVDDAVRFLTEQGSRAGLSPPPAPELIAAYTAFRAKMDAA